MVYEPQWLGLVPVTQLTLIKFLHLAMLLFISLIIFGSFFFSLLQGPLVSHCPSPLFLSKIVTLLPAFKSKHSSSRNRLVTYLCFDKVVSFC